MGWLFGEDQARYVIASSEVKDIIAEASAQNIKAEKIGQTKGRQLTVGKEITISLDELVQLHQSWLPNFMSQT